MGKYDKFYENYYKKLNSGSDSKETNFYYDESRYMNNYSKRHKKMVGGTNTLILILVLILGAFGVYKFRKTQAGQSLYSSFLEVVNSIKLVENNGELIAIDKKGESISETVKDESKFVSSVPSSSVPSEDNIQEVNSDKKYSEFVSALNGIEIKAKSEEGLVLSCKYKIIATSLPGVIDNIGENAEGYFLTIDHGNNIKTAYYNLPKIDYVIGQKFEKGEKITEIKEEREIVFKIKENDKFVAPRMYLEFIK